MSKKKILVTGANGQLGSELRAISENYPDYEFHFMTRAHLDLGSEESIKEVCSNPWDILINAGAYTKVDLAETEIEMAKKVNTDAIQHFCKHLPVHTKIIHVSTDYVYNIAKDTALVENDDCNPQSVYAKTKYEGEQILMQNRPDSIILRTSWVYSYYGHNFVKSMLKLGSSRDNLSIVSDQIGTPTYAYDLAEAILSIIESKNWKPGIFNYSNEGVTHWADFARKIFELSDISCEVGHITTEEFGAAAPRPLWSVMDKTKIKESYGIEIPDWEISLEKCLKLLNQ